MTSKQRTDIRLKTQELNRRMKNRGLVGREPKSILKIEGNTFGMYNASDSELEEIKAYFRVKGTEVNTFPAGQDIGPISITEANCIVVVRGFRGFEK